MRQMMVQLGASTGLMGKIPGFKQFSQMKKLANMDINALMAAGGGPGGLPAGLGEGAGMPNMPAMPGVPSGHVPGLPKGFTPSLRDAPALVELSVAGDEPVATRAGVVLARLGEAGRAALEARLGGVD